MIRHPDAVIRNGKYRPESFRANAETNLSCVLPLSCRLVCIEEQVVNRFCKKRGVHQNLALRPVIGFNHPLRVFLSEFRDRRIRQRGRIGRNQPKLFAVNKGIIGVNMPLHALVQRTHLRLQLLQLLRFRTFLRQFSSHALEQHLGGEQLVFDAVGKDRNPHIGGKKLFFQNRILSFLGKLEMLVAYDPPCAEEGTRHDKKHEKNPPGTAQRGADIIADSQVQIFCDKKIINLCRVFRCKNQINHHLRDDPQHDVKKIPAEHANRYFPVFTNQDPQCQHKFHEDPRKGEADQYGKHGDVLNHHPFIDHRFIQHGKDG